MAKRIRKGRRRSALRSVVYSGSTLRARYRDVYYAAARFVATRETAKGVKLSFDPAVLYLVVVSTYDDIARFKNYHLENPRLQKSDAIKRAAFYTKWLVHFRPFYVIRSKANKTISINPKDSTIIVNEEFSIGWALSNLCYDLDKRKFNVSWEEWNRQLYDLKYRMLSAEALMAIYQHYVDLGLEKPLIIT